MKLCDELRNHTVYWCRSQGEQADICDTRLQHPQQQSGARNAPEARNTLLDVTVLVSEPSPVNTGLAVQGLKGSARSSPPRQLALYDPKLGLCHAQLPFNLRNLHLHPREV